jgi:DNA-binding XRE family transcriptional regulator
MSTLKGRLESLPPTRRRKVERRYRRLKAEQMMLDELRRSLGLSQAELARRLGVRQPRVSKFEKRPDAMLQAMRRYVEALGGRLEVAAVFDNGRRIEIKSTRDLATA